ncbi:MAG TPA: FtsX-like permease family protein, partial [Blastocatellia bacterium]|nr:FtsX-like permease family protein [Blastocatellia bacterium]
VAERPATATGQILTANFRPVSPDYFGTLHVPLIAGRTFTDYDDLDRQRVVIVDQALVRMVFGATNPIGNHIQIPDSSGRPREIVGVVGSVLDDGLDKQAAPTIYLPYLQSANQTMSLIVRTSVQPGIVVPEIKSAIWTVDRNQPVFNVRKLNDIASNTVSSTRTAFALLVIFSLVALTLAAIGIYGVVSYSVSRRMHEIGVRFALGAARSNVLRLVVGQGMRIAGIGITFGAIAALGLSRLMSSLLYGVATWDPIVYVSVTSVLLVVAVLANFVPALRAARVSPMAALRYE